MQRKWPRFCNRGPAIRGLAGRFRLRVALRGKPGEPRTDRVCAHLRQALVVASQALVPLAACVSVNCVHKKAGYGKSPEIAAK